VVLLNQASVSNGFRDSVANVTMVDVTLNDF